MRIDDLDKEIQLKWMWKSPVPEVWADSLREYPERLKCLENVNFYQMKVISNNFMITWRSIKQFQYNVDFLGKLYENL